MQHVVITIARQYGSGGRTVGKMLAKNLNIPYYSGNLLKMASEESGINEQLFRKLDEKLKNSPFLRMSSDIYTGDLIPPESSDFVSAKNPGESNQTSGRDGKLCDYRPCGRFYFKRLSKCRQRLCSWLRGI